jgi:hypothetical protein
MSELEEFTEGDRTKAASSEKSKLPSKLGKKKKKRTEKDVYAALADKIKKAIKDLEAQHKTTVCFTVNSFPLPCVATPISHSLFLSHTLSFCFVFNNMCVCFFLSMLLKHCH